MATNLQPVPSTPSIVDKSTGVWDKLKSAYNKYDEFIEGQKGVEVKPNPAAVPKPSTIINEGSYKSLADVQATGYSKDARLAKFAAARQLKDPSQAPTPELKMQAVSGKLSRLYSDPKFIGLSDKYKEVVLGHYYDKYVAPALRLNGIEPPDRAHWMAGYGSQKTYKESEDLAENKPLESRAFEGAATMLHGNANLIKLVGNALTYTIGEKAPFRTEEMKKDYAKYGKGIDKTISTIYDYADSVNKIATDYESSFQPRTGAYHWASNFAGQFIGDAPAYMIAGGVAGKMAEGVIPSLAEKGAMSKGFAVALSALKNAGEVFSVREGEGAGLKQSTEDAVGALVFALGIHGAIAKFGGAKLAAGGEPLANKISEDADKKDAKEGVVESKEVEENPAQKIKALVNPDDPDYKQVVENERFLREHFARELHPEKVEVAGNKSVWRNLSKGQRATIKAQVSEITKQSGDLQPLINPELQIQANSVALAREAAQNPEHAAFQLQLEKETGLKVAEVMTKAQAKEVGTRTGLTSTASKLEQSFGHQDVFSEARTAGVRTVSNKSLLNPNLSTEDFIRGTTKYLEKNAATQSGYDYFENPEHHLLWIANHSDAPDNIKNAAFTRLRKDFNISHAQAITKGQWLAEHVSDLRDTGILAEKGNIYRSTKVTQRRYGTEWQQQLYGEDLPEADMASLKSIIKAKPELKASIENILETLNFVRNKAATPLTSRLRRNAQKQIIDILKDYK